MKNTKKYFYLMLSLLLISPTFAFAQELVIPEANTPKGTILGILQNFMNWLLAIVGILGVISFVISGILYLTAAGNEDQIQRGKRTMIYSIIGVVVAMLGVIVMQAANSLLGGNSKSF